ncbi:related to protocatechuate 3,4-dioxygenase beta subunit [Cephalotrichum gorgonifer]|uniref:Related to protocatechuate 3,4-dioxygenase beta subunit n=1 Tax=Cephalotrichum gorgonifer TaxID=2041049 RepID=A0AAE8MWG0_9PEZI|nr:related to protocatechuate 3,4-dioxygenase beta subunit [Cephalotrichum gorgonifer]
MMELKAIIAGLLLAAAPLASAHPGHEPVPHHAARPLKGRDLNHCSKRFAEPQFHKRFVEKNSDELLRLRRSVGVEPHDSSKLHTRDYISVSQIDHKVDKEVTLDMSPSELFADAGACILMPAVDQGPLYVLGEEVRKDITNSEAGVKMTLAIQVVDVQTCEPVTDAYVDIWSSNSTGIYVGVQGYPGMGDPNDPSILKGTTLRGVQPTDEDGISTFDTLMPGHYEGRATHIHAIVYLGATKQANNTITGGRAAHVGQLYFDQSLIAGFTNIAPYSQNTMAILPNTQDFLFQMGANGDDPIVRYSLVGDKVEDGLYAWIRFGINVNANMRVNPAAFWTENGGVMNPTGPVAQLGGGFGGFPGGGFGGGFPGFGRLVRRIFGRGGDEE